jgi:hypothetical protein
LSNGYKVVMSEVLDASRVFGQASQALIDAPLPGGARNTASACLPGSLPDAGDATIDTAITEVLHAAGMTTGQLSAVIASHAGKLRACYDKYHGTEESNARLFHRLLTLIGEGT